MGSSPLVIASRGSKLALWQAHHVADQLTSRGFTCRIEVVTTSGDRLKNAPLHDFGGKGLFAKEIEIALRQGRAELAVHSSKDLPVIEPSDLTLICALPRVTAGDVLLCNDRRLFDGLTTINASDCHRLRGLTIATGSLRRKFLLLQAEPSLTVQGLRGNVDSRLAKLQANEFDVTILAEASLQRLAITTVASYQLDRRWFVPSCGQGVIVVQSRRDFELITEIETIGCQLTMQRLQIERAIIRELGGSCALPFACHVSELDDDNYTIDAVAMSSAETYARVTLQLAKNLTVAEITKKVVDALHDDGLAKVLQALHL